MQTAGKPTGRIEAIDAARALAVIGVVFNHAVDGMLAAGLIGGYSAVAEINHALYTFRMPALAFILGLFIPRALGRRGTKGYLREKVTFAVYIYLVWFVIQMLAEIATSSVKNTPRGFDSLLAVWSIPSHLWFLPYLAVAALVVSLAAPWTSRKRLVLAITGAGGLSIATWGWNLEFFGLRGLSLLLFSVAGAAIGKNALGKVLTGYLFVWVCVGAVAVTCFFGLVTVGVAPGTIETPEAYTAADNVRSILAAALGIIGLLSLAVLLGRVRGLGSVFQMVGSKTLEIYLAHVIVVAGARIVLSQVGLESSNVILTVSVVLGVSVPMMIARIAPTLHLAWLFQVPGWLGIWSRAANTAPERMRGSRVADCKDS